MLTLPRSATVSAIVACGAIALVGVLAGSVRLLPWLLDPTVPWRVAAPFARGLAAVALEAALLVGWPAGWALACLAFVERGEARVLLTLGERPSTTVRRLLPQGALLAMALAGAALAYGEDASEPGRVATELIADGRTACARVSTPTTYSIPFTTMTWLCGVGRDPLLAGNAPGGLAGAVVTAKNARIGGDFRTLELHDARIALSSGGGAPVAVHVASLTMRGMAPWARASGIPAALRALVLVLAASGSAAIAAYAALRGSARTRIGAIVLGVAGPLATLALMRLLERMGDHVPLAAVLSLPLAAAGVSCAVAWLLPRLRLTGDAASTWFKV